MASNTFIYSNFSNIFIKRKVSFLDSLSGTTVFAYSTRPINKNYSGPLLKLMRSSDLTMMDVPQNYAGIADWISDSASASMVYWYDQSGRNNHLTSSYSTSRPIFYLDGDANTNYKPYFKLTNSPKAYATCTKLDPDGQTDAIWSVVSAPIGHQTGGTYNVSSATMFINENSGWGTCALGVFDDSISWRFGTGQSDNKNSRSISTSNNIKAVLISKRTTVEMAYLNGVKQGADVTGKLSPIAGNSDLFQTGGSDSSDYPNTKLCEVISYKNIAVGDETLFHSNQMNYYGIS